DVAVRRVRRERTLVQQFAGAGLLERERAARPGEEVADLLEHPVLDEMGQRAAAGHPAADRERFGRLGEPADAAEESLEAVAALRAAHEPNAGGTHPEDA